MRDTVENDTDDSPNEGKHGPGQGTHGPDPRDQSDPFYARLVASFCADSIVITDAEGLTEWVNPAFETLTGFRLDDMRGQKPGALLQGDDTDPNMIRQVGAAIRMRQPFRGEILNYTRDGVPYWIDMSIKPIFDAAGTHTHFISVERDITDRKKLETRTDNALARDAKRQKERSLIGITSEWLYAAKSMQELTRVVESAMRTIFPETSGALYVYSNSRDTLELNGAWGTQAQPDHLDPNDCWGLRRGRAYAYGTRAIEFPCDHMGEDPPPYICMPIIASGDTIGLLHMSFPDLIASDCGPDGVEEHLRSRFDLALLCAEQISLAIANVQLRQELRDQSTRDPLTNLWNRRWFLEAAHREINRAQIANDPVSLISFDVDHFKTFNDCHGHDAGDWVLKEVARLMINEFAETGHACRIGGEEFVVLLPNLDAKSAHGLAESFRLRLAQKPLSYGGTKLPQVTVSAGIAGYPDFGPEVVKLLKAADMALYKAKDAGRNTCLLADTGPNSA